MIIQNIIADLGLRKRLTLWVKHFCIQQKSSIVQSPNCSIFFSPIFDFGGLYATQFFSSFVRSTVIIGQGGWNCLAE